MEAWVPLELELDRRSDRPIQRPFTPSASGAVFCIQSVLGMTGVHHSWEPVLSLRMGSMSPVTAHLFCFLLGGDVGLEVDDDLWGSWAVWHLFLNGSTSLRVGGQDGAGSGDLP